MNASKKYECFDGCAPLTGKSSGRYSRSGVFLRLAVVEWGVLCIAVMCNDFVLMAWLSVGGCDKSHLHTVDSSRSRWERA